MGRRKIEMKKISNESSRLVTFSKRRVGLFKKANELSTLCGAMVAIVMFSPAGKPFSFGQPDVKTVINRFFFNQQEAKNLEDDSQLVSPVPKTTKTDYKRRMKLLSKKLDGLHDQIEAERKRGQLLDDNLLISKSSVFSIDKLGLEELMMLSKKMEDLKQNIGKERNELEASASLLLLAHHSTALTL